MGGVWGVGFLQGEPEVIFVGEGDSEGVQGAGMGSNRGGDSFLRFAGGSSILDSEERRRYAMYIYFVQWSSSNQDVLN